MARAIGTVACEDVGMCSTVLWTINHAAYMPGFRDWTRGRLGVEPRVSPLRIDAPELVGRTAVAFTLPLNMCDCGSAVGYGEGKLRSDVPGPEDYAAWLRELPGHARFTSRVCVVRTWNPEGTVRPGNTERIGVSELDAAGILMLPEETLLAVDFPVMTGW